MRHEASGVALRSIRACFDGAIPAMMATCAADGTPNVAYLSQVYYVDERHVALSFQFFNKTRANILAHPYAAVLVMNPITVGFYRLHLRYLRTETSGPLFEGMKAQLAGIASHSGMADVFRLLGADVYEVLDIDDVPGDRAPEPDTRLDTLAGLREMADRLARCTTTDEALQSALAGLTERLDIRHAMVLMHDNAAQRLYTVASCGYASSGIGAEIEMGHGVIGVAARERTPVRISHMTHAASYSHAVRASMQEVEPGLLLHTDIPFPGLDEPSSQLAVPIISANRLMGVLFVESQQDMRFGFADEDAMVVLAGQLGATLELLQQAAAEPEAAAVQEASAAKSLALPSAAPAIANPPRMPLGPPLLVRHFEANHSIFVDQNYLIKGVAGAILWKLLREHQEDGRCEFSNRELRLDPSIGLPDVADNLEARLVLLQRRLLETRPGICLEKTGRGRFRLRIERPLKLAEIGA
ncbi:GAF domain-containing protein [Variovorax dokdonensis]|uniref:GAF domain-containing protein n=1 Tax=Variovorax dokdonensis TaxID=344883 RepID=A0ABT7NCV3_9BURK|nr:GAF domain-containing protein [Variovorax dokdonensis]MDM0045753.1 GAF domain-containing protein [Variovorax dokdonensis]